MARGLFDEKNVLIGMVGIVLNKNFLYTMINDTLSNT